MVWSAGCVAMEGAPAATLAEQETEAVVVVPPEPVVLPDPVVLPEPVVLEEPLFELEVPAVEDAEVPLLSLPPQPARHSAAPNNDTRTLVCCLFFMVQVPPKAVT
jgi:hypothetical protein